MGSEVVRDEPLAGDNTRHLTGAGSGFWAAFNRNKKSLAVNLKSPAGMEIVKKLLASALANARSTDSGTASRTVRTEGAGLVIRLAMMACAVGPV